MSQKITKKQISESFKTVIEIPYGNACALLHGKSLNFHTEGVYGWYADVYIIDNETAIVTGYRPFGKSISTGLISEFNERAVTIISDTIENYEEMYRLLDENLHEFIEKAKGE